MMSFSSGTRSTMRAPCGLERLKQSAPATGRVRFALDEDLADQPLKGLRQGGIGNVAFVLVELARCEEPARRNQGPCAIRSPPRICRCRNNRRPGPTPACRWLTTRSKEASNVAISRSRPYSFSGISSRSDVSCSAEREWFDAASVLPFGQTVPQVGLDARRGLIAFLCRLGEKLHHDVRKRTSGIPLARSPGARACRAIWQCTHSIGSEAANGRLPSASGRA